MTTTTHRIRCLRPRDLDAVLAIERASFHCPWNARDFRVRLRYLRVVGMVAVGEDDEPIGYMIYRLFRGRIRLLNIAVDADYRRCGIGRAMIDKLREKLLCQHRRFLFATVSETNLDGQLFLRAVGLRVIEVLRKYYSTTDEDAYCMRLDCAGLTSEEYAT